MDVNPVTLAFNLRLVSQKTAKNTIFKYSNFKYWGSNIHPLPSMPVDLGYQTQINPTVASIPPSL